MYANCSSRNARCSVAKVEIISLAFKWHSSGIQALRPAVKTRDQTHRVLENAFSGALRLANQHKFSICVQLAFRLTAYLRGLAWTRVELKFVRKSTEVFHHLATQHKLIASELYICVKFTTFCDLRIRLATHRKSVRKFCFANLRHCTALRTQVYVSSVKAFSSEATSTDI